MFKLGRVEALVATDVAARGIHVDGVVCVLHYDTPEDGKAYLHRSGRTARAGAGGLVVSLVGHADTRAVSRMQRDLEIPAPMTPPDVESVKNFAGGAPGSGRPQQTTFGRCERRTASSGAAPVTTAAPQQRPVGSPIARWTSQPGSAAEPTPAS